MNFEKIGKVTINYLSDSEVKDDYESEDLILRDIQEKTDYEAEMLRNENNWSALYHFSLVRENLLEWYDFGKGKSLLEVGAGCGALTGLFCRKLDRVVAVDLSRRCSVINATRNMECSNLEIIVGSFDVICFDEKYDYVTLIGGPECADMVSDNKTSFEVLLKKVKEYLKPGGVLIIAVDNKYGIKYWAGAKENHTLRAFDSIQDYDNADCARTFSKAELEKLIRQSGFSGCEFYYPLPDYILPMEIYSEYYKPGKYPISGNTPNYDCDRYSLFNEEKAMNGLIKDGRFEEFANSFLVFCH